MAIGSESNGDITWMEAPREQDERDRLVMTLEIYEENLLLKEMRPDGMNRVRRISADEVASACIRHMGSSSGLLPPGALWWKQSTQGLLTAVWAEPRVWPVALNVEAFKPPARLRLPMPGLVFILMEPGTVWVFAAKQRPEGPGGMLYMAPAFNVFEDGRVCPGSHRFPARPEQIPASFFASHFSQTGDTRGRSHRHPDDLRRLWEELDEEPEYPLDDLVELCTVEYAMALPDRPPRRGW